MHFTLYLEVNRRPATNAESERTFEQFEMHQELFSVYHETESVESPDDVRLFVRQTG